MSEEEHNGPGFHYMVRWRRHDLAPTAKFEERPVDSKSNMVIIDGQSVYKPYEIYVLSVNDAGDAVSPPRMLIGYSSEDGQYCFLPVQWLKSSTLLRNNRTAFGVYDFSRHVIFRQKMSISVYIS